MKTTSANLEKRIDKITEELTPAELARIVTSQAWEAADTFGQGKDPEPIMEAARAFIKKYVWPLSTGEYIDYLIEIEKVNGNEWGRRYYKLLFSDLEREAALIDILLITLDKPKLTAKEEKLMKLLLLRHSMLENTVKEVLESDFWETTGIERPPKPDIKYYPDLEDTEKIESLHSQIVCLEDVSSD